MDWLLLIAGILVGVALVVFLTLYAFHRWVLHNYLHLIVRIFQEKPLFIIPFGKPSPDAEQIEIDSTDGVKLKACYVKTTVPRKGVILFGLEFGTNRWACLPYCEFLLQAGYDCFACETRGQGQSPSAGGYEPRQWVTDFEVQDYRAALAYLKARPDAERAGIGLFGLSKGGSAGLVVGAEDPYLRCFVVDGIFSPLSTMVPYMRQWIHIYTKRRWLGNILPDWYYRILAVRTLERLTQEGKANYPCLEEAIPKLAPRPLFMIHGGADNYIKPEMARVLFDSAGAPKELWIVDKAKHNQAFHLAAQEYQRRVRAFFDTHLVHTPQPLPAGAS